MGTLDFRRGKKHGAPLAERFDRMSMPEPMSGCTLWLGATNGNGYGMIQREPGGHNHLAHRVAWEMAHGPIPDGVEIDHRCTLRSCVNAGHLRLLTHRANLLASSGPAGVNARKTHCPQGHAYDRATPKRRRCSVCISEQGKAYRQRRLPGAPS